MRAKTKQEDARLIKKYIETGAPEIRDEIIIRFVPLVHYVLSRLGVNKSMGQDHEDLVSQGLIGLIESIDKYDPKYGTQFSTYATLRIRGKILDYMRAQDWLSRSARQRARLVQNAVNQLWAEYHRMPTVQELSEHLGLDSTKVEKALVDASHVIMSLDVMAESGSEENVSLYELLADKDQQTPAEVLDESEIKKYLIQSIKTLPEREQQLLSLYYFEELTLREIGEVLGVSESRVSQLHARAVMSLRACLADLGLDIHISLLKKNKQKSVKPVTKTSAEEPKQHSLNITR